MTIQVTVNGSEQTIPKDSTLVDLLNLMKVEGRLAIDVNGNIIPKSAHGEHQLTDNDRVEIVHAIGGG